MDDLINLPVPGLAGAQQKPTASNRRPGHGRIRRVHRCEHVSHACPTMYVEVALDGEMFLAHEESALKLVDSPEAYKKMHQTICAMAGAAVELVLYPESIETAKVQLRDRR